MGCWPWPRPPFGLSAAGYVAPLHSPAWLRSQARQLGNESKIARCFSTGNSVRKPAASPAGAKELQRFCRPDGTRLLFSLLPSTQVLGYFQSGSLGSVSFKKPEPDDPPRSTVFPAWLRSQARQRGNESKIARCFSTGNSVRKPAASPAGTKELQQFCRPDGTRLVFSLLPSTQVLGYFRSSLPGFSSKKKTRAPLRRAVEDGNFPAQPPT